MSWLSDGCDGDRDWKCYYESWNYPYETWCRDVDGSCPGWDDGGTLIDEKRGGGGGGDGGW
jgi:hypothetical protein